MAPVKLKSIVLLTGGIFVLFFFHFVPVGLGNVTVVGTTNPGTAAEMIKENTATATATMQSGFESKQANVRSVMAGSFDTRFYVVPTQTSYLGD